MGHSDHLVLRGTTTQQGDLERALGARVCAPGLVPVLVPTGKVLGKPLYPSAPLCNALHPSPNKEGPGHQLRPADCTESPRQACVGDDGMSHTTGWV